MQYKYAVALIYTVVLFLDRLDLTITNVAIPSVSHNFNVSIIETDWISISFLLALSISIPISSWLGERFGLKKVYITSIVIFGAASTMCAVSTCFSFLVFSRFIHGIGGGLLIPVGMTMLYRIFDKSDYASITSFTFIPSLIAPLIAPFIGGLVLDYFGWRYVFLFSGPICLILAIIAMAVLKDDDAIEKNSLDLIGFILSSCILIDIFLTLSALSVEGFSLKVLAGLVILIVLCPYFIWHEKKCDRPLVNLSFFSHKTFANVNLIQFCFQFCHFGAIFLVNVYLQVAIGMEASMAGLIMGMQALGAIVTSRYSVKLFKISPKLPIMIGLAGVAFLSPCIMLITRPDMIIFGMILFSVRGIFSGLCGTPIQTLSVIDFSKEEIGKVGSIFNACRQVAISFGIAASSFLLSIGLKSNDIKSIEDMAEGQILSVFSYGFFSISFFAFIGILLARKIEVR